MATPRTASTGGATPIVSGGVFAGEIYTHAYNALDPGTEKYLNEHFPKHYNGTTHTEASHIIHEYNSSFNSVPEREAARQLIEEGRLILEGAENAGLPENFGEYIDLLTHPLSAANPGGVHVPLSKGKAGEPAKGTPKSAHETSAGEKGEEEAEKAIPNWVGGFTELIKAYALRLIEILFGGALLMFGLVTLARGGRAPSLPPVVPVPA